MCGIAGIMSLSESSTLNEEQILRMMLMIQHRGPDESGIYLDPKIALGNVRLSIIGLTSGTQPISNEDETLWIVYNGEIFNYLELKEELEARGHLFRTDTDTEIILHLYEEMGPACLSRLNGQFAIALWDNRKKELFLARDRVGIRPLFYCHTPTRLVFASEIKAIMADREICREIDPDALCHVFSFWSPLSPETIFRNIHEIPPGHYMLVRDHNLRLHRYWQIPHYPPEEQYSGTFQEACEELRGLLLDAVRIRLRADVPVGAYLSGGLDSSIITALVSQHFDNRLKTFSMTFEEADYDEETFQDQMIRHLGTDHHKIEIFNTQMADHFPQTLWHCEVPLLRTAPIPLMILSDLVRRNSFKVVLTGEGADEIFGGYNIFKEAKIRAFWAKEPQSQLRPLLLQKLYPYVFKDPRSRLFLKQVFAVKSGESEDPLFSHRIRWRNSARNTSFFSDQVKFEQNGEQMEALLSSRLPEGFSDWDILSRAQFLEMTTFLSSYLLSSQGDRVAMANSLEIRLPFLDYRIIDFAARIPPRWKLKGLHEKHILRQAFKGSLPGTISQRVKHPYRAPIREAFFSGKGCRYVDDLLSEDYVRKAGYFDEKKVSRLLGLFRSGRVNSAAEFQNMAFLGILSTQLIYQQFIKEWPPVLRPRIQPEKVVVMQPAGGSSMGVINYRNGARIPCK